MTYLYSVSKLRIKCPFTALIPSLQKVILTNLFNNYFKWLSFCHWLLCLVAIEYTLQEQCLLVECLHRGVN